MLTAEEVRILFLSRQLVALTVLVLVLVGCSPQATRKSGEDLARDAYPQPFSESWLDRETAHMSVSALALAARHTPGRRTDFWGRPTGWAVLDLSKAPDLGFMLDPTPDIAEDINALRPFSTLPILPMRPFVLAASMDDTARALTCLTQAVYYEAGQEPKLGQEAVAQVILNRLRHPAYPKSICGVVYQGASRSTGCQFTFTCDGSLGRPPDPLIWRQAEAVARQALGGHVVKEIGTATHYHAGYVAPYWAPTLVKMVRIGQHIFYRWTGPGGQPAAFKGRYAGAEFYVSPDILGSLDARTQGLFNPEVQGVPAGRQVTLGVAGDVRTYTVADPLAVDGERTRVQGALIPSRRKPTPDEIRQINAALEKIEKGEADAATTTAPQP
ncbi:MAG: cell wall hydrolase [Alphaproteobacteria bacterium PA2]|nr:MAG: cell wall hydrolase [Alphaproteobacteria bacterium PA2]